MYKYLFVLIFLCAAPSALAASLASGGPVDITADQLDVHNAEGNAVFTGNVVVRQNTLTLTAPKLTVSYAKGGGDITQMQATGGATITRNTPGQAAEKATGSTATYNPSTQTLTMTDNVTLVRGPSTLSGDKLVYAIATGNAQVTSKGGPVKARFVPTGGKP